MSPEYNIILFLETSRSKLYYKIDSERWMKGLLSWYGGLLNIMNCVVVVKSCMFEPKA